eukprot:3592717-Alexandrium_andersonii.AAC.1
MPQPLSHFRTWTTSLRASSSARARWKSPTGVPSSKPTLSATALLPDLAHLRPQDGRDLASNVLHQQQSLEGHAQPHEVPEAQS